MSARVEMVESGVVRGRLSLYVYQILKWRSQVDNWTYESVTLVEV